MDKYARNYLAEGVKNKEDIIVTPDSEIYKNLNQHYNRNNHIQASFLNEANFIIFQKIFKDANFSQIRWSSGDFKIFFGTRKSFDRTLLGLGKPLQVDC